MYVSCAGCLSLLQYTHLLAPLVNIFLGSIPNTVMSIQFIMAVKLHDLESCGGPVIFVRVRFDISPNDYVPG